MFFLRLQKGLLKVLLEGEKQSIYLNDTPIENEKGDDNFEGTIDISFKDGQVSQDPMPGFKDVKIEQSVGIQCVEGIPVPVTTTSNNFKE